MTYFKKRVKAVFSPSWLKLHLFIHEQWAALSPCAVRTAQIILIKKILKITVIIVYYGIILDYQEIKLNMIKINKNPNQKFDSKFSSY